MFDVTNDLPRAVAAAAADVMSIDDVTEGVPPWNAIRLRGRLLLPSHEAYGLLAERFRHFDRTPLLRKEKDGVREEVLALPGTLGQTQPRVALAFLKNMTDLPHRLHGATQQARVLKAVFKTYGLEAVSIDDSPVYSRLRTPGLPHTMSNGMLCIDFGSREQAYLFTDTMAAKNVGRLCVSLGSVNTYYCPPAQTTHSEIPPKEQLKVGIKPGLVRISCGLESNLIPTVSGVLRDMGYMHVSP